MISPLSQIKFKKRDNGCGADNECGFNEYCSGITALGLLRGQCRTLLPDGSVCVRNEECLNLCSSGRCTSCTQVKLILCMPFFGHTNITQILDVSQNDFVNILNTGRPLWGRQILCQCTSTSCWKRLFGMVRRYLHGLGPMRRYMSILFLEIPMWIANKERWFPQFCTYI